MTSVALPRNEFKVAIRQPGARLKGLWVAMGSATSIEIAAEVGYDWLLIDGEHGPNDLNTVLDQLRAVHGYPTVPVVRPPHADPVLVKQVLDLGAQTLLLPMINTREEAELMVRAVNYAPEGIRGVGGVIARSGRWGLIPNYMRDAKNEICTILQIESEEGLNNIDEIAAVPGYDAIFIGPADLSASLGHPDDAAAIQDKVRYAFERIKAHGKAIGSLAWDPATAKRYFDWGASFVAVAGDTDVLVRGLQAELAAYEE